MNDTKEYLQALYYTLRKMKGREYHSDKYKWLLGTETIKELALGTIYTFESFIKPMFLYGIAVEIDYTNPHNIQLFEDITNKIYIQPNKTENEE